MIAPFFLLGILAGEDLAILWGKYQIYQLPHPGWNCEVAVITQANIFQLFYRDFSQPFLPSSDLSLAVIFHLFLDPRSAESHAHLINLEITQRIIEDSFALKLKN